MKKRILVTGSAGFIGSHLVDMLVTDNSNIVFGIDDFSGGYKENIHKKSQFFHVDLKNEKRTAEVIQKIKPEMIFHLAADAAEGRSQFTPISSTQNNYISYLHVLVPAIKYGLKKMILVSSMSVYGAQSPPFSEELPRKPEDMYGIAKAAMEQATEVLSTVYGFSYVIVRPHNVYGPRQNLADPYRNVIGIFINRLLQKKPFYIYGTGEQKRAFTYIDDLVPYIIKASIEKKCEKQIYNLGPQEDISINEIGELVLSEFYHTDKIPRNIRPRYLPFRPQEVVDAWCTIKKAERELGYKTTIAIGEGIKKTIVWAKEKGPQEFRYLSNLELVSKDTPVTWTKKLI